jgi:adenylosuccinate synthase
VGYLLDGREISDVPPLSEDLARVQPKLEVLRGWKTKTTAVTKFRDLPAPARDYVRFLEERCGAPSILISTGPRREETIWREDLELYADLPPVR